MSPHATMEPMTFVPSSRAFEPVPNLKPSMLMLLKVPDSWLVTPSATPLPRTPSHYMSSPRFHASRQASLALPLRQFNVRA